MSVGVLSQPIARAATAATPLLVYRDRIGAPSEIQFLRRQYIGFTRLTPVWIGRHVMPQAATLDAGVVLLGGDGPSGWVRRALFRHFGHVPALPFEQVAPVLHAQFARGGALALPLAQALGLRLVVTLHGGDVSKAKNWRGTVQARRWPAVVASASRFVCVSAAVAGAASAHGVPHDKLTVLPIGVEIPAAPPPVPNRPHHLFVGRFVPKKGIGVLALAIRRLRVAGDTTPVVCIGDGPDRPVLESLARDVKGVTLTGWLPPDAVAAHMAQAWSLLVPSVIAPDGDAEGLPSVIPEAMAQACPIICSAQGGLAEAVKHGQTGLLVPPGDPAALAEAMRHLVSTQHLRHDLGQAAFGYAAAHLNACIQSAALETLLLEVGT
jgi:colanic acid/amylovoran biosynthesis glycosyltransferase